MKTIAFIGLGRMGLPMASNLIKAGFDVIGCDLDIGRRDALAALGGQVAATPAQAAARSDMSISMIMNDAILRAVAMGPEGVLAGARAGHVYADLSTVSPAASAEVAAAARAAGIGYVCAILIPLALAELVRTRESRRLDWPIWVGFLASGLIFLPLLPVLPNSQEFGTMMASGGITLLRLKDIAEFVGGGV